MFSFSYNEEGMRIYKERYLSDTITYYYYDGTRLVAEKTGSNITVYLYDGSYSPIGFVYITDGDTAETADKYYFEKNLQGDIVGIYGIDGTKYVSYVYDAFGNCSALYSNGGNTNTSIISNHYRCRG